MDKRSIPVRQRLLEKKVVDQEGCWIFQGEVPAHGYGMIWYNRKRERAHRVSFEVFSCDRPLTSDDIICHTCDVRRCINPEHLFLGTRGDNNKDSVAKGRNARGERNGQAKLTLADIGIIRSNETFSQKDLAAIYGVGQSTISRVKTGQRWKKATALAASAEAVAPE